MCECAIVDAAYSEEQNTTQGYYAQERIEVYVARLEAEVSAWQARFPGFSYKQTTGRVSMV